jgi:hypothetical protein
LLDFAKATLDAPLDFPKDVWDEFLARKREEFGPGRWLKVLAILRALERRYGIYLANLDLGNEGFDDGAGGKDHGNV